ncbi:L-lactate dehydrogenase complex protein LldG [Amycolatopsis bartoniae]|uniref:Lactate utilization protein C n=1 Tax=Amycolatopsis bartoniae TaxID=941986 RepID=A0A8H9MF15_9PSEU|nr:lactate utilization protein C [Amycolatopsis bartoniae]MBB2936675.1 L-lactate dehydrogenase complex protein LldG [Amycolatopsis bartoniae]TVT09747.1 lactate utilization protein C [Amycolatopsis bartoniae]GHF67190.1 lactate utilization protein C [Amycolatopsis bartoniae]
MADARAEILARVRVALRDRPEPAPVPREYASTREYPDVTGLAAERIADYRAEVRRATEAGLPGAIAETLRRRGVRTVVTPPGLPREWHAGDVRWLTDEPPLTVDELDAADGVLTGCAVTIAETGTIVLDGGPGQGRRALTLVPDYHLCVVRARQIVATVPEGLARLEPTRPLTFVSGPSATSDIELSRVEGVHGPRTLDVLLIG